MMTQNKDKKRGQIQMFCMDDMVPLIQYLYGIRSMRQTVKEIEVNVVIDGSLVLK